MSNATLAFEPPPAARTAVSTKISAEHLRLGAVVYVRQSTSQQLRDHQESTARQYQLTDRLLALGWAKEQIIVIDDDLGISGNGKSERPGFRRLLKLVTEEQVGIVLGLEMSRLARNSRDWAELFEVCAIFRTLIADEDGVFDPQDPNDRLVLGLKGIISELELHTMKVRLERGRINKAERGELFHDVPVGYVRDGKGLAQLDPDASARRAMELFFVLFETLGSATALFQHLAQEHIRLPFRVRGGPIEWRVPSKTCVYEILKHPLYAGAYSYGRKRKYPRKSTRDQRRKFLPPEQWKVWLKDRSPAYITWEQYECNQRRLHENDLRGDRSGPVRGGAALLSGILFCGHCGRRLAVQYHASGNAGYGCGRHRTVANGVSCQCSISNVALDAMVSEKLLEALKPSSVELSLRVVEDESARRAQLERQQTDRVERSRYASDLAERRYKEVDPANRLVAATLEQQWEAAMVEHRTAVEQLAQFRSARPTKLDDDERQRLLAACNNVAALWREHATIEQRKQIVRLLIDRVEVQVHQNGERVSVTLHWSGGYESHHEMVRGVMTFKQLTSYQALLDRVLELTRAGVRARQVASVLATEGYHSPRSDRPISADMVNKLCQEPRILQALTDPRLEPHHWRSADLAKLLAIPEKRLKAWVTWGWVTAIQRPHGNMWVLYADERELLRLRQLVYSQTGQSVRGPTAELHTPAQLPQKET